MAQLLWHDSSNGQGIGVWYQSYHLKKFTSSYLVNFDAGL